MLPETGVMKTLLDWAWIGVCALIGIVWRKHNDEISDIKGSIRKVDENMTGHAKYLEGKVDALERRSVPRAEYESNRKEMREGQVQIFTRLDHLGQALARIEGKLDK